MAQVAVRPLEAEVHKALEKLAGSCSQGALSLDGEAAIGTFVVDWAARRLAPPGATWDVLLP